MSLEFSKGNRLYMLIVQIQASLKMFNSFRTALHVLFEQQKFMECIVNARHSLELDVAIGQVHPQVGSGWDVWKFCDPIQRLGQVAKFPDVHRRVGYRVGKLFKISLTRLPFNLRPTTRE